MPERPLKTRRFLLQGRVITPKLELANATVMVEGQRIAWVKRGKVEAADSTVLTEVGDTVVPGFIDLQVNGLAGHDAAAGADAIAAISSSLPRFGVTGFLPTLISRPLDEAVAFIAACATADARGAPLLGAQPE